MWPNLEQSSHLSRLRVGIASMNQYALYFLDDSKAAPTTALLVDTI